MYGSVEELREISQVTADDFELVLRDGQEPEDRLDELLAKFLRTATEWINIDRERNFETEPGDVPEGITNIALRLAANMAMDMIERQDDKVVKRDENGNATFRPRKIFTDDLKWELSLYTKGSALPSASWPRMSRVRSEQEMAYGSDWVPRFYS